jgi:hypothetical protein
MDSSVTRSGLSLQDGTAYTFSVRATDIMGNTSVAASTNDITLDITPPTVTELAPIEYSVLPVSETSNIIFTFSEIVTDLGVDVTSNYGTVDFTDQHSGNKLTVNILPPFASLDTVVIELKNITDRSGLVTEEDSYEFRSSLLADYNYDFTVDVEDLSSFVDSWQSSDLNSELGPVQGTVPNLISQVDGVYDIRDGMTFTRMWHWSHGNTTILARSFPNVGDDIDVEQSPQSLTVSIPDEAIAGEVVVQYEVSSTDITLNGGESADRILINNKDAQLGQIVVDFGYLKTVAKKQLTFDTEYENDPTITLSYIFYGRNNTIISMGTREMDLTAVPDEFSLHQNYPNPFNPTTTILYDLPEAAMVHLVIYDVLGRQVRTLVNQDLTAGYHRAVWDATDDLGRPLSGGLYIYRIQAGGFSKTMKMVLLK